MKRSQSRRRFDAAGFKGGSSRGISFFTAKRTGGTFRGLRRSGSLREGLQNQTEQRKLLKDVDSLAEEYKQEIYDIISEELERGVSELPRLEAGVGKLDDLLSKKTAAKAEPSALQLNPQVSKIGSSSFSRSFWGS